MLAEMRNSDGETPPIQADEVVSTKLRKHLMNGLGLAPAGANVIMQLSRLPIGHGVAESRVESGSLYLHPVKRTRTTLGYVMIALFGTEHERTVMRSEVNRQHRYVHSNDASQIEYDAFDRELQLWVAACMYRGLEDAVTFLYGPANGETLDLLYKHSARFATTLQVPEALWPDSRAAFDVYWNASLSHVAMDETTRSYLSDLASLKFLPVPLYRILGPPHRFITAGFLPAPFRDELGLKWDSRHQYFFDVLTTCIAVINRSLPRVLREFPWNLVLWDTRRRIGKGHSVV